MKRVGDALAEVQLEAWIGGCIIILPVTARTDFENISGEQARMLSFSGQAVAMRLDELGDSDISDAEESRREAARNGAVARISAFRHLILGVF